MPGDWPGSELFFAYEFEDSDFQQALGQHLLELRVFPFQLLQPFGLVDFHLTELLLPPVEAHLREIMLSAYLPDALAGVYLPQDPDLVFCAVSLSFHGLWAWLSQRLTHHLAQIREDMTASYLLERENGDLVAWNCSASRSPQGEIIITPTEPVISRVHVNLRHPATVEIHFPGGKTERDPCAAGMKWIGSGRVPEILRGKST